MKNGLDEVDRFVFNAVRLAVSVIVLVAFALRERKNGRKIERGLTWKQILVYSVIVSGLYQLLFLLGISRTTSGNTALIISTIPMWTALLARVFLNERLLKIAWLGLFLALAGTVLVAVQKGDVNVDGENLVGNICILGAAFAWSIGTVYSRPMLKKISPMQLSACSAAIALPFHLSIAGGSYTASWPALQSTEIWLIILYSGILSTGLALPMWNFGVRHAGAAHAAVIQNLVPIIAIAAAWLTRDEVATTAQVVGGSMILGGLIIMRLGRNTTAAPAKIASK